MINGQPVTEGKLVGVNKDGYVAMVITDYAADSSAFLNLYRRYLWESPAEPSPGLDWVKEYGGFAWIWKEDGSDIQYLEAGILDRFHLRVRSNLPDSDSLLQEVAASHRWQSIHR